MGISIALRYMDYHFTGPQGAKREMEKGKRRIFVRSLKRKESSQELERDERFIDEVCDFHASSRKMT